MDTFEKKDIYSVIVILLASIAGFKAVGLDENFLTSLLLAIFSISISIYFFVESSKISRKTEDILNKIDFRLKNIEKIVDDDKIQGLIIGQKSTLGRDYLRYFKRKKNEK